MRYDISKSGEMDLPETNSPMLPTIGKDRFHLPASLRPMASGMEPFINKSIPVLDHGFVMVMDYMGDDEAVVNAARVSYGTGTKATSSSNYLIKYLMKHRHTSPFEMCELKVCLKMPLFVARQWIRHRTASINEYSARYSILDSCYYLPSAENINAQSTNNKQGRGETCTPEQAEAIRNILRNDAERCYANYLSMLNINANNETLDNDRVGIARELARVNLNLNFYTTFYWKIDAHNLMHFLKLRCDKHAQLEIRVYADVLLDIFRAWLPLCYKAFVEYQLNAVTLSEKQAAILKDAMVNGGAVSTKNGLSDREFDELKTFGVKLV